MRKKNAKNSAWDAFCRRLDGMRIGNVAINRSTAVNDTWLTVYSRNNDRDVDVDEQLSFSPQDLLKFCRRIMDVAGRTAPKPEAEKRANKKCAKNVPNDGSQEPPFVADRSKIKPYDEGFEAAECGSYRTSCPYDFETPEGLMWMEGYRKAGGED